MAISIFVLADIIHFITIIVLCDMFFLLQKREVKYRKWMLVFAGMIMAATSVYIFACRNYIFESILYVVVITGLMYLLYKEKLQHIAIITIGIIIALSMIDEMAVVMVNILMELFNIFSLDSNGISTLVASIISLVLVCIVGCVYRKNTSVTLKSIGVANLVEFTILLAVDTFVVIAIISQPNIDLYLENKNIYLISIVFVIIGIFIQLASVILLFTQRNVYKEKEEITDKYLNEQKSHYEYLENREKETKKFRHDLRSHMKMISNLAKNNEYDKIDAYLEQMQIKIDSFGNIVTVQNGIVDAIINQYYTKALECGVTMEVKGRFPVDCSIDAFDLCTIFSNVLSNALEAAVETDEKYISIECGYTDRNIIIVVKNSYCADVKSGNTLWITRKVNKDYHGYGLENIKDSVDKYNGVFDIETKDNRFGLNILFNNAGK